MNLTPTIRAGLLFIGAVALSVAPAAAQSGAERSELTADDLSCVVDDRWVGGQQGGYWPVRIALENRGPDRAVTAAFVPYESRRRGGRSPLTTRTVALTSGAGTRFTLLVPLTAERTDGELVFLADPLPPDGAIAPDDRDASDYLAGAIVGLTREIHPPRGDPAAVRPPATLILEGTPFDAGGYAAAVNAAVSRISADSGRLDWRRDAAAGGRGDLLTLPPAATPEVWLGFATVDLVVTDAGRLAELSERRLAALNTWLRAGGTLAIVAAAEDPAEPLGRDAVRLLELDASDAAGPWETLGDGDDELSQAESVEYARQFGSALQRSLRSFGGGGRDESAFDPSGRRRDREVRGREEGRFGPGFPAAFPRPPDGRAPLRRAVMGGRIYVIPETGGDVSDWFLVFRDLGPDRLTVADRWGVNGRGPNREFFEFLIPGVRGVPVGALVALITLFALVIGPLNYWLLRRRHQVGRLAVTVPLIAAGTSAALLGYSTLMHGFDPQVREFAVTLHDPGTDRSITWARSAAFAPRTPGDGLNFAADAAVLPLAPPGPAAGGGRVDWTGGQHWSGDAFRGRTRTQFVTVTPRPERGRLSFDRAPVDRPDDRPAVVNGYADDFALLLVADDAGTLFVGADVPAGGRAVLTKATGDDLFLWRERLDALLPEAPPEMEAGGPDELRRFAPMLAGRPDYNASYRVSLPFRTGALLRSLNEKTRPIEVLEDAPLAPVARGAFVALLAEPDEAEFGGLTVDARGGAHVLIGVLGEESRERPGPARSEPGAGPITVRRPGGGP